MRRANSDPTAGERARKLGTDQGQDLQGVDPTDPRYRERGEARPVSVPTETRPASDPTDPRPVGHVFGHRRGEVLATAAPGAPVLRLRGFRPPRRVK
jgi:hypothetical protein